MTDWQSIETAPQDGSMVQLDGPHPVYPTEGWWDEFNGEWAASKMAYTLGPAKHIPEPTRWRPLDR